MTDRKSKETIVRRRIFFGTIGNTVSQVLLLGTGFILTPFILQHLGPADYGLWVLVSSFIAYGQLLDLGIASAIIKYIPDFLARGETHQAQILIATALRMYSLLGIIAISISLVLAPVFPVIFKVAADERSNASWLVIIMGLQLGISIVSLPTYAILRGLQRYNVANLLMILGTLLWAGSTIVVLGTGGNLLSMVAVNIPVTLFMQCLYLIYIKRTAPEIRLSWRGANRQMVGKISKFSSAVFLQQVGGRLQQKTDEIVIGITLPLSFVTPYSIARRLSEIAQLLTYQYVKVLMPLASQLQAENDLVQIRKLYLSGVRLGLLFYLPLGCSIVMLSRPFLTLWVGVEYANYDYLVLLLTLSGVIMVSQAPVIYILQGMGRHQILAITSITSGLVNLVLSLILVQPLGLMGVALGTLIPTTIENLIFILPYSLWALGIKPLEIFKTSYYPVLVPVFPMIATVFLLEKFMNPSSFLAIVLVGGSGLIVYLVFYIVFGAATSERQMCYNILLKIKKSAITYLKSIRNR